MCDSHILRILNDVFEDANDSRMWRYVPLVLPATLLYMQSVKIRINK